VCAARGLTTWGGIGGAARWCSRCCVPRSVVTSLSVTYLGARDCALGRRSAVRGGLTVQHERRGWCDPSEAHTRSSRDERHDPRTPRAEPSDQRRVGPSSRRVSSRRPRIRDFTPRGSGRAPRQTSQPRGPIATNDLGMVPSFSHLSRERCASRRALGSTVYSGDAVGSRIPASRTIVIVHTKPALSLTKERRPEPSDESGPHGYARSEQRRAVARRRTTRRLKPCATVSNPG
jgi:hypothetical protein